MTKLRRDDSFTEDEFQKLDLVDTGATFADAKIYRDKDETVSMLVETKQTTNGIRKIIAFIYSLMDK